MHDVNSYAPFVFMIAGHGVPAVTCLRCGATLTLMREHDVVALHDDWHAHADPLRSRPWSASQQSS